MSSTEAKEKIDPTVPGKEPVWFIELDDRNDGPVTEDDIRLMLRTGEASPEAKVWKQGMKNWTPARETYRFRNDGGAEEAPRQPGNNGQVDDGEMPSNELKNNGQADDNDLPFEKRETLEQHKPEDAAMLERANASDLSMHGGWLWYASRRWLARHIDLALYSYVAFPASIWLLMIFIGNGTMAYDGTWTWLTATLLFLGITLSIDAVAQGLFGNTLGKKVMGLQLVDVEGKALPFARTLGRNVHVGVFGLGAGIPIAALIAYAVQAMRIRSIGMAGYDRPLDTRVVVRSDGFGVVIFRAIGGLFTLFTLAVGLVVLATLIKVVLADS